MPFDAVLSQNVPGKRGCITIPLIIASPQCCSVDATACMESHKEIMAVSIQ